MSRAPYALVVLAALVAAPGPVQATACPLLADAAGDVMPGAQESPVSLGLGPGIDIVSADVASGATTVVGVLRVRSLDLDPFTYGYASWSLAWQIAGTRYWLGAQRPEDLSGGFVGTFSRDSAYDPVAVDVDHAAGTFTWTMPRSWFPELATPGRTFDGVHARTGHAPTFMMDLAGDGSPFNPTPMYVDGTPGCVPAA